MPGLVRPCAGYPASTDANANEVAGTSPAMTPCDQLRCTMHCPPALLRLVHISDASSAVANGPT
jgi:hypothetical protein